MFEVLFAILDDNVLVLRYTDDDIRLYSRCIDEMELKNISPLEYV